MTSATGGRRLLLAALCVCVAGCAGGPFGMKGPAWRPEVALPALLPHEKIKSVVVSGFTSSLFEEPKWPTRRSALREGPRSDISVEIASALREAGLDARAEASARPDQLRNTEVLVRGAIRGLWPTGDRVQAGATCLTGGIYGCVLPYAVPYNRGVVFQVRVEVVDSKGSTLMASTTETKGTYGCGSAWAMGEAMKRSTDLLDELKKRTATALAQRLRE